MSTLGICLDLIHQVIITDNTASQIVQILLQCNLLELIEAILCYVKLLFNILFLLLDFSINVVRHQWPVGMHDFHLIHEDAHVFEPLHPYSVSFVDILDHSI